MIGNMMSAFHKAILKSRFRIIRSPSRRSSSAPTNGQEPTDEEKAAVVGQGMKSFAKKYGIIIFPSLFFSILTIDVVNNICHREWVEEHWPFFVNLVREKYGFDDEDEEQRLRMICMRHHYSKPMTLEIVCEGSKVSISLPTGTAKLEDVVMNNPKASSCIKAVKDIYCSNMISFPDDEVANNPDGPLQKSRTFDESPKSSLIFNEWWVRNSLWDSELISYRGKSDPVARYFSKFENVASDFFLGMDLYKAHGNALLTPQSEVEVAQYHARRQINQQKANDKKFLKHLALEKIQRLELEIHELNQEKRIGFRDSDAIDQEIQRRVTEITQLRRSYVNLFYFF